MTWDFRKDQLALYAGTGLELITLNKPDTLNGKGRQIGKAPLQSGWRRSAAMDARQALATMEEGHNIGVRLRDEDLVIDEDPRAFREGDRPLERFERDLGISLGSYPTVVTGSGGRHIYMRKPADVPVRDTLEDYPGLEFKSLGRQVVAAGSVHPETRRPYLLDDLSSPLDALRQAPRGMLELIKRPGRQAAVDAGGVSPEQLEGLLEALDPEQFRDHTRWLNLMMACHHATEGEGRQEFLGWSAGDPLYSSQASTNGARWDSLSTGGGERRVTKKTLFKEVKDAGHVDRLLALDRTTPAEDFEDAVLEEIEFDHVLGGSPDKDPIDALNSEGYHVVNDNGRCLIYRQVPDYTLPTLPGEKQRLVWQMSKKQDFFDLHANRRMQKMNAKGEMTTADLAQEWFKSGRRHQVEAVVFDPARRDKRKVINLWTDWAVQPKVGDWSLLRRLLREGLCGGDQEAYEYCLRWAAWMVQNPDMPAEVAVVFRGTKGTGKSTWGRTLKRLCGQHGLQISNQHHLTGHFNAHMRDCIFLFADEAQWGGDRKGEGELKRLITEDTLQIEPKGKDPFTVRNMLHIMMASNEDWVVPASTDERRYAVFDVSSKFLGDVEFFTALHRQLNEEGGMAALLWDLKVMDLAGFHPRSSVPVTGGLLKQKLASLRGLDLWLYDCLLEGDFTQRGTDISPNDEGDWEGDEPVQFYAADLQLSAEAHLKQKQNNPFLSKHASKCQIGEALAAVFKGGFKKSRGYNKGKYARIDIKNPRPYVYTLPPLEECRAAFTRHIGGELDWS